MHPFCNFHDIWETVKFQDITRRKNVIMRHPQITVSSRLWYKTFLFFSHCGTYQSIESSPRGHPEIPFLLGVPPSSFP